MLDDAEQPRQPAAHALAAEGQDGVRGGADVARGDLPREEVLEPRLLGGDQQERRDARVVVPMGVDELAVLPHGQTDLHPERLGVPVEDRPVELVEHEELDRVGRRVHGLDAVHHHAPRARGEVEVDERAHRVEGVAVRRLPVPVELEAAVGCRNLEVAHAPDPAERVRVERVELTGRRVRRAHRCHGVRPRLERPPEQPRGVLVVLLGVAATVHVQHDATRAVGDTPVRGEGEAEVGLADAGGAVDARERARQQAAAEHRVELREAGRDAVDHEGGFYTRAPAGPSWRTDARRGGVAPRASSPGPAPCRRGCA